MKRGWSGDKRCRTLSRRCPSAAPPTPHLGSLAALQKSMKRQRAGPSAWHKEPNGGRRWAALAEPAPGLWQRAACRCLPRALHPRAPRPTHRMQPPTHLVAVGSRVSLQGQKWANERHSKVGRGQRQGWVPVQTRRQAAACCPGGGAGGMRCMLVPPLKRGATLTMTPGQEGRRMEHGQDAGSGPRSSKHASASAAPLLVCNCQCPHRSPAPFSCTAGDRGGWAGGGR